MNKKWITSHLFLCEFNTELAGTAESHSSSGSGLHYVCLQID